LRDAGCSFRKSRLLPLLLLSSLALTQCRAEDIWGVPLREARQRLGRGDASFLRAAREDALREAFRLGPGSPYYLSFWAEQGGDPAQAQALLTLQWERGGGRWKEEAALALLAGLAAQGQWTEAERQAHRFLPALRSPELRRKCERALAEALYWQRKDAELLPWLDRLADPGDDELELFRAAASCRLSAPDWPERFRELFYRRKVSGLHPRAYSFLLLEERLGSFPPVEAAFFGAKAALAEGRAAEALPGLEASLPGLPPALRAALVPEAAGAFLQAGEFARGARFIASLAEDADAHEWTGRLARRAGDLPAAAAAFRRVARDSADPFQRDRASWFLLDLARDRSAEDFLSELEGQTWADPSYFADLIEQETSAMVARRQWALLGGLRAALGRVELPGARARLAFLEGRLRGLDLLAGDPLEACREAARLDPGGYYGRLAAALLPAEERPAFAPRDGEEQEEEAEGVPAPLAGDAPEAFLLGFIEHGLYQAGYRRILAQRPQPAVLLRAARELAAREQYLLSLRLLARYLDRAPPAEEVLRLYYPRGYAVEVEELCRKEGIPPAVFFALVREESHFDAAIVSSAGAVGLTQLLPETAREVARLLKMEEPDLRDPGQNLRIGARHLARLAGRLEDLAKALIAYNAGIGRLRSWEHSFASLPSDLLVEAVPFAETRRYVRKILVSAVHYGWLYYDLAPQDTVRLFYPLLAGREAR